jgi:hypothetical protein
MTVLTGIFSDPNFKHFRRNCFWNEAAKIGVVLATQNSKYPDFAMNEPDFTRLVAAKDDGRANEAWVVFVRDEDGGHKRTYRGARPATELRDQIKTMGLEPRDGQFGQFFVLPGVLRPDSDDDPF